MKKPAVLVVDDSPAIVKALRRSLNLSGSYEVFTADSARQALAVMDSRDIDVLMTDENMPETSGTELLKICRVLHPRVIRIMLTGQTDQEVAKKAINDGEIVRFFTKPWDDFELLISIRYALQQRDLTDENQQLRARLDEQQELLARLERLHPGITRQDIAPNGTATRDREHNRAE
jgi:DNA-binding NtrC family response regulator